ncbi:MAG: DUF3142 domain-containing protein [Gammaproteobacteria bacterium]|nr:DUF3142 domain-containing protein [Gammaproteobacteria bacterium]
MRTGRGWLLLLLIVVSGCQPPPALDQQLYIWQRQWRPSHGPALAASRQDFSTLRLLALQYHPQAGWAEARPDLALLATDGRPLVAVVRLDGQLTGVSRQQLQQRILPLLARWQQAGVNLSGLEIDHDCRLSQLPAYRQLLSDLRPALPAALTLSITALPSWLESTELPALLTSVDHSVLQLHSVDHPERGLFDGERAARWAERWGEISPRPYYLALPAYGLALINSGDGPPLVEGEVALATAGPRRELQVSPQLLADFVSQLQADPPPGLAGLLWFRLPLADDRRSWPMATLLAVVRGQPLAGQPQLTINQQGNLAEFSLSNSGNAPLALPATLTVPASGCTAADGLRHYRTQISSDQLQLQRRLDGELAAGQQLPLGWARCHHLDPQGWTFEP